MADEATRRGVRETYDAIASHFAETRHHAWPEVREFVEGLESGDVALDLGCGNGRHAALLAERFESVLALDASPAMLREARSWLDVAPHLLAGDATALPVRSDAVDAAIYVATIHHLPTREARIESLNELARVLAPGASALVSSWSTAHDRFDASEDDAEGFDATIGWTLPDDRELDRFVYVYAPAEFEHDVGTSDLVLERHEVSSGNCYAVVRTTS